MDIAHPAMREALPGLRAITEEELLAADVYRATHPEEMEQRRADRAALDELQQAHLRGELL